MDYSDRFRAEKHITFVSGAGPSVIVDQHIGLGDGFAEVNVRRLVRDAAVLFAREEPADVLRIDARATFAQFKSGAIDHRHSDDIAANRAGIGLRHEIENGDRTDDLRPVNRTL